MEKPARGTSKLRRDTERSDVVNARQYPNAKAVSISSYPTYTSKVPIRSINHDNDLSKAVSVDDFLWTCR